MTEAEWREAEREYHQGRQRDLETLKRVLATTGDPELAAAISALEADQ